MFDQYKLSDRYDVMYDAIIEELMAYIISNKMKSLIIGESGGIDSAIVTALARDVCDRLANSHHTTLMGVSIPIDSKPEEIKRAEAIGKEYCPIFEKCDMTTTYHTLLEYGFYEESIISDHDISIEDRIRRGNIKARLRMMKLFHYAHKYNGMVLSTDNLSEYYLGFWTLHGDVGNYGPIQNLWKTEVYGLSKYVTLMLSTESTANKFKIDALAKCIEAVPTDGLGITNSDFEQIGVKSYREADDILIDHLTNGPAHANSPVIQRMKATQFKRHDPINICRNRLMGES